MGSSKPTLGYPSRTAAISAFRDQGLSTAAIAAKLSISSSLVSALELGVSRKDKRRSEDMTIDGHRAVLLSYEVHRQLRPHAARRDVSVDTLAQMIIETAVKDDMVGAILDDGKN